MPDYHQKHHEYPHMDFQVYGMRGGQQIPKWEQKSYHYYKDSPTVMLYWLPNEIRFLGYHNYSIKALGFKCINDSNTPKINK